jgi:hypothetical protein
VIGLLLRIFFGLAAAALIAWAVVPGLEVLKLLAVALGLTLIFPLAYPALRGVRKGDGLLAIKGDVEPFLLFSASSCVSLENGKRGDTVAITLPDGTLAQAVIVSYEGLITPAKVRVVQELRPRTADGVTVI